MRRGLLTEAHEEVCDVHYVRGIPSGVVIHFVLLAGLVLDNIQEDVDRRLAILGGRTIPIPGDGAEKAIKVK